MSKSKSGSAPFDLPTVEELTALPQEDRVRLVLDSLTNIQNNLRRLESRHMDVLDTLSPNVRKHVEALQELQKEHNELEAKFFEERVELEAKYQKLYEPLYTKRYEIVNGVVQHESNVNKAKEVTEDKKDKGDKEKGVPNFWLTAMKANEMLEAEIQEHDEKALKYLKDIKWCRNANAKGLKLEFYFDSNPFFSNSFFSKTYHMGGKGGTILEKAIGTEIQWYPGMSLIQKVLIKLPNNGSKNINPITKTENCGTFFKFFNPPQMPDEDDDLNDETAELLKKEIEHDYNIGSTIKDKIIPHAVSWFIGEAVSSDGEDDEDEDDEDDDGYDKEEDEEEVKFGNLLLDAGAKKESEVNQRSAAVLGEGQERPPEWKLQFKLYTD